MRGPEFPEVKARTETVSVTLRAVREKSIAVSDGTQQDYTHPVTGAVTKQDKWMFLPRFYVDVEGVGDMNDTDALEALIGKAISVTAGERLLIEKGLL